MRWNHIKTVMIVILLGVNVWLAYLLVGRYMAQSYLDADTVRDAVQILARDDLYLTVDQIDPKKRDADVYEAVMSENYFLEVAAIFTDSPVNEMLPTPNGMRLLADSGDSISLSDDFAVTFLAAGKSREQMSALAAQIADEGEPLSADAFALRRVRSNLDAVLSAGIAVGGSVSPAHAKLNFDEAYRLGDHYLLRCSQEIDEKRISGNTVECICDTVGNLLWLDGTWSFLSLVRNYSAQLYDQINILFMEKATLDELREAGETWEPMTLERLDLCYISHIAADEVNGGGRVYYSPAWRIRYTDGTERIYSAVTGEPVEAA